MVPLRKLAPPKPLLFLFSALFAVWLAYHVAETYFFDKFFYQKSVAHGYFPPAVTPKDLSIFGERSKDLLELESFYQKGKRIPDSESYTIAVIGDSFVWGLGTRFKNSLTQQLERMLAKKGSAEVLALGYPKDSILDYVNRYEMAKAVYPVDLYIFVLVENDLVLNYENRNLLTDGKNPIEECTKQVNEEIVYEGGDASKKIRQAFESRPNLCALEKSLELLPTENAIYFLTNTFPNKESLDKFKELLEKTGKNYLSTEGSQEDPRYKKYWQDPQKYLFVSKIEQHPSKLAHKMYAELLFEEIIDSGLFD